MLAVICVSFVELVLAGSIDHLYLFLAIMSGSFCFESSNDTEFSDSRGRCF